MLTKFIRRAEWERRLKRIPRRVRDEVLRANGESASDVADLMRAWVPVRTGALRRSIRVTPPGGVIPPLGGKGRGVAGRMQHVVSAGDEKAFYALFVEFGTKPHKTRGKFRGMHPGSGPRPFFYPVWRIYRRRVKIRATRAMRKAVARSR